MSSASNTQESATKAWESEETSKAAATAHDRDLHVASFIEVSPQPHQKHEQHPHSHHATHAKNHSDERRFPSYIANPDHHEHAHIEDHHEHAHSHPTHGATSHKAQAHHTPTSKAHPHPHPHTHDSTHKAVEKEGAEKESHADTEKPAAERRKSWSAAVVDYIAGPEMKWWPERDENTGFEF